VSDLGGKTPLKLRLFRRGAIAHETLFPDASVLI
jgi:hypothetical protein